MAVAIGSITQVISTPTTITLTAPAGTANTGAMTYQWYRSITSGFAPGAGNILAGATGQSYEDVIPPDGTGWNYVCIVTDTLPSSASTPQLSVSINSYQSTSNDSRPSEADFGRGTTGQIER